MSGLVELLVDAAVAVFGAAVVGLLLGAAGELTGAWREAAARLVRL